MKNKFQTFFEKPYKEICKVMRIYIHDNDLIIDLGCNNGNLEDEIEANKTGCLVYAIDKDLKALKILKSKEYKKIKIKAINQDANAFIKKTELNNVEVILVNATLHEINNPKNQPEYLNGFFKALNKILKKGGRIILGDYYYHPSVSDKEVKAYLEYQKKEIGHADPRNKFISPNLLKSKAKEHGYAVIYSRELRAVKELDRRYYSFVFEKARLKLINYSPI